MKSALTLATLIGLAMIAGCASDGRSLSLNDTLESYRKTIRWDAARTAAQYLHPEQRPSERQLGFQLSRLEQFKVSGYQTTGPGSFDAEGQYVQTVQINLSNRHTAVEKTLVDRQSWQWDDERERWWLTSGLPDVSQAR